MKIAETFHDRYRSLRLTHERFISMGQALDIFDPFIERPYSSQNVAAAVPCWTAGAKIRILFITEEL